MQKITFQAAVSFLDAKGKRSEQLGSTHCVVEDALKELYLIVLATKPAPENENDIAASILLHFPMEEGG